MVSLARSGDDSETSGPGVRGQLAPINLFRILVIDLAHPALVRGNIRSALGRPLLCAIDVDDCVIGQSSRMAVDRSSGKRSALAPDVLLRVINLNIVDRAI